MYLCLFLAAQHTPYTDHQCTAFTYKRCIPDSFTLKQLSHNPYRCRNQHKAAQQRYGKGIAAFLHSRKITAAYDIIADYQIAQRINAKGMNSSARDASMKIETRAGVINRQIASASIDIANVEYRA